jgi:hypothetical protein
MGLQQDLEALAKEWKDEGEPQAAAVIEKALELQAKAPGKLGQVVNTQAALAVLKMPDSTDQEKALKAGLEQYAKVILGQDLTLAAAQGK